MTDINDVLHLSRDCSGFECVFLNAVGKHQMATDRHANLMEFNPTLEDMQDFHRYIRYMESVGADRLGAAKVGARVLGTGCAWMKVSICLLGSTSFRLRRWYPHGNGARGWSVTPIWMPWPFRWPTSRKCRDTRVSTSWLIPMAQRWQWASTAQRQNRTGDWNGQPSSC